jgi:hypothetical protein
MFFFIYAAWFLNLVIGSVVFLSCYRTSLTNYFLLNTLIALIVFFIHSQLILIEILKPIFVSIPLLISLTKIFIDRTVESRTYEKNLSKIILFLDLSLAKARFGRGIKESLCTSHHIITGRNHVRFILKDNVVLQQPKSRFFKIFSELEGDLNTILGQKVAQKELIDHVKRKYQKRLVLHQKTKIALSQFQSQTSVIILFWMSALSFLIAQSLFFKYLNIIAISFSLLFVGSIVSKKLLIKTDFRI